MSSDVQDFFSVVIKQDWWSRNRSKEILNQKFATVLTDKDLSNVSFHKHKGFVVRPRMPASMKASGSSVVNIDEREFQISLDLDEFELGEIQVKAFESCVEVSAKHEERRDEYGLVSREFFRRYWVPNGCDALALTAEFSTDRQLTMKAPVKKELRVSDIPTIVHIGAEDTRPKLTYTQVEFEETLQKAINESYTVMSILRKDPEGVKALEKDEPIKNKKIVC